MSLKSSVGPDHGRLIPLLCLEAMRSLADGSENAFNAVAEARHNCNQWAAVE